MLRIAKCFLVGCAAFLLTAQLVRPLPKPEARPEHRPIWDDRNVTPEVKAILRRSCADCHSDQTRWPWYSHVAPISWMVAGDVRQGRQKLDFSDWPRNSQDEKQEIGDAVASREMPPRKYLFLHPSSRLSPQDIAILDGWINEVK